MQPSAPRIAIHGGAGVVPLEETGTTRQQREQALAGVVGQTWESLVHGSSALEAVELAVSLLEDCPWFNAGRGSVLNSAAAVEMDAAIMDGRTRGCGAVAAVTTPRNPVKAARAVMERSGHLLLAGTGADRFCSEAGLPLEPPEYFIVPLREQQLRLAAAAGRVILDHDGGGTVGAVARDRDGNLAAATSTGGMTNKRPGRVGDTPLIGAGTWAENATCAVSATGHGESLMRAMASFEVHAGISFRGLSLAPSATAALEQVRRFGGSAGLIAVSATGELAAPFNSAGMYRAWIDRAGQVRVATDRIDLEVDH